MTAGISSLSAAALTGGIRRCEISAREALDAHFARIDAVNGQINVVVTEDREKAVVLATAADALTVSGADHVPEFAAGPTPLSISSAPGSIPTTRW